MSGSAWSNQVQNQVIVVGSPGGVLSYSPSIGANNLISSVGVAAQFTDPYGNVVLQGTTSYNKDGLTYQALNINQGQINWFAAATEAGPWVEGSGIDGRANVFNVGAGTGAGSGMQLLVQQDLFRFLDTVSNSGMDWQPTTQLIPIVSGIDETFHSVVGDAGWSAVSGYAGIKYRFDVLGNVQFTGAAQHASITATTQINSSNPLPSAYRPATIKVLSAGNSPLSRLMVEYRTDGILYALANASSPGTIAEIDAKIPLSDT